MFTMSSGIASQARLLGADAVVEKDDLTGRVAALRRSAATRAEPRTPARTRHMWANTGWPRAVVPASLVLLYVTSFVWLVGWLGDQTLDRAIPLVAAARAPHGLRGA